MPLVSNEAKNSLLKIHLVRILAWLSFGFLFLNCSQNTPVPKPETNWTSLLDKDLSQWDKFIGVPHYTVNLPGYPKGDGINGTPVGLNNDPLHVFKTIEEDGELVLQVSGEIYGGLSTKKEYSNYHFRTEFKWGNKKYEPRLQNKRDSGILYHAQGKQGAFWNVWMVSQEMQVQETDLGDYFSLGPLMDIRASSITDNNEQTWIYDPAAAFQTFGTGGKSRCRRNTNQEKPHGEWNTLELICLGQKSLHIVNGKVVMVLQNSRRNLASGLSIPLTAGKIQLQSEGAEVYYRNLQIRQISEIPEEEEDFIDRAIDPRLNSRLACQCVIQGNEDLVVTIPNQDFLGH